MAEMYGELMELNDRLHRELAEKEAIVQRLSQQMQSRGISVSSVPPQLASSVRQSLWVDAICTYGAYLISHVDSFINYCFIDTITCHSP